MCELEGDVAPANEQQAARKLLKLEKCGAGRQVLASRDPELHGLAPTPICTWRASNVSPFTSMVLSRRNARGRETPRFRLG